VLAILILMFGGRAALSLTFRRRRNAAVATTPDRSHNFNKVSVTT